MKIMSSISYHIRIAFSFFKQKSTKFFIVSILLALFSFNASAATYNVTRFDDPSVTTSCTVSNCSLRQAVIASILNPGSTINLPPGTYTLSIPGLDYAGADEKVGDLDLKVTTTINGSGVDSTIIQAGATSFSGSFRLFDNISLENVTISNLTIRNGQDLEASSGGCIRNLGVMTLDTVKITGCKSPISGGGIGTYHQLTIINSTITNNWTHHPTGYIANGGGIINGPGPTLGTNATVNIIHSIISNNISSSEGDLDLKSFGGGISNNATMTVSKSTVTENTALNAGGIINGGTGKMTITNSTISNNKAKFDTGGIDNENQMSILNSTISGNIAGYNCSGAECDRAFVGGIINWNDGTLTIDNTTISGNQSLKGGGGVLNGKGIATISSSTIVRNTGELGAGIAGSDPLTIKNSIVAENIPGPLGGGLSGKIVSQGYNLFQDTNKAYLSGDLTGNLVGIDPGIEDLLLNEGYTATHALSLGSPAKNTANPGGCLDSNGQLLQTDQRGYPRTQFGRCDIGAFEVDKSPAIVPQVLHLLLLKNA